MINTRFVTEVIIGILILIFGYFIIKVSIPKPVVMPQELLQQIDSLKTKNAELEQTTKTLDSTIENYKFQISILDSQIVGIETKTVVIKEKAHETSTKVKKYKNDEVDSFFKDRYKY